MPDPLIALLSAAALTAVVGILFWPDRGLFWRWQQARALSGRVLIEDALKHIHKLEMKNQKAKDGGQRSMEGDPLSMDVIRPSNGIHKTATTNREEPCDSTR